MAKYLKRASMGPYHTVSNRSLPTLHMSPGCQAPLLVLTPCISQILRVGLYTRYVHVPASHVDAASSGRQWSSKSTPWSPVCFFVNTQCPVNGGANEPSRRR